MNFYTFIKEKLHVPKILRIQPYDQCHMVHILRHMIGLGVFTYNKPRSTLTPSPFDGVTFRSKPY